MFQFVLYRTLKVLGGKILIREIQYFPPHYSGNATCKVIHLGNWKMTSRFFLVPYAEGELHNWEMCQRNFKFVCHHEPQGTGHSCFWLCCVKQHDFERRGQSTPRVLSVLHNLALFDFSLWKATLAMEYKILICRDFAFRFFRIVSKIEL